MAANQTLDVIVGQVPVFFDGASEGTISDLTVRVSRTVTSTGCADGQNRIGFGIDKINVSFKRPALKDSTRQLTSAQLAGPIDIDYVRGDQTWRLVGFVRDNEEMANTPEQGNTTDSYSGMARKRLRIK